MWIHRKWKRVRERIEWVSNEKLVVSVSTFIFAFFGLEFISPVTEREKEWQMNETSEHKAYILLSKCLMFVAQQNLITFYKKSKQTVIIKIWFILSVLSLLFAFCACKHTASTSYYCSSMWLQCERWKISLIVLLFFFVSTNSVLHFDFINVIATIIGVSRVHLLPKFSSLELEKETS